MFRSLLILVLGAGLAGAADRPIAGDRLTLKDPAGKPERRNVRFKATRDLAIDPALGGDPRALGATLEIVGRGPDDGTSGVVTLDQSRWEGLGQPPGAKGFKWLDPSVSTGVRKVYFKSGSTGGQLTVSGKGTAWGYRLLQPQDGPIDVRFTIGGDVWCARMTSDTFDQNLPGKLRASHAPAPADCGVPSSAVCGDGATESPEECDDGGTAAGDGCSATCQLESVNPAVCAGIPTVSGTALDSVKVAGGLEAPVHVTAPRLDTRRIFIVEQPGRIRVVRDGTLLPTPFLDITGPVNYGGEQGLLSMAFHPDYETNGQFFVYYVNNAGNLAISRFSVSGNPDIADDTSEDNIITISHPSFGNHNGGNLNFGPDGFLYAATGDGGGGCGPNENSQNDGSMLGKILRINVATDDVTIWAKGLRNPWRFSFDRGTGDLYVADVGQNAWEEVNFVPGPVSSGVNYGWDFYEANHCSSDPPSSCSDPCPAPTGLTMPVLEYSHGQGCSISGGFVYRGCRMPDLAGTYFFSDICTPFIRSFNGVSGGVAQNEMTHTADLDPPGADQIGGVSSFGEDARGEMYIVDYGQGTAGNGEVYRIVPGS